jgi:hydroxymethylglutaryl-CoA lyase/(R)-citramalyl-CoA lyase
MTAVRLCDVAPRDGLQSADVVLVPELRAELCERLLRAGLPEVEAVSFVRADRVPQMAGAERVMEALGADDRERCAALVLNERGLQRALAAGVRSIHVAVMATESFSRHNAGASVAASLAAAARAIDTAHAAGARVAATVSVAFGCPLEGDVDPGRVAELAQRLAAAGADELMLADTLGMATPDAVARLCGRLTRLGAPFGVHLHDSGGAGCESAWAAVEAGATILESSVGGIGGCPFAPGATGNVATEELVRLLEREGVATGVSLAALLETAVWLKRDLVGIGTGPPTDCMHVCNSGAGERDKELTR